MTVGFDYQKTTTAGASAIRPNPRLRGRVYSTDDQGTEPNLDSRGKFCRKRRSDGGTCHEGKAQRKGELVLPTLE
jgi:hypothetical protein